MRQHAAGLAGFPHHADDLAEAAAITAGCDALVLNLGTPHAGTLPAMAAAGKQANQLGHPVVLDPVGVGASPFRRGAAEQLFREVQFSLIRGNISEVKALLNIRSQGKGVDAGALDAVTEETIPEGIALAQQLWAQTGAAVAITGVIDLVADGEGAYVIRGGHPMLSRITGSGCMLSAVCGAFLAACRTSLPWRRPVQFHPWGCVERLPLPASGRGKAPGASAPTSWTP